MYNDVILSFACPVVSKDPSSPSVYVLVCIKLCIYVWACVCAWVFIYTCVRVCVRVYVCELCVRVCVSSYVCVLVNVSV